MKRRLNEKGFTLPEVMLVLLISVFLVGLPPIVSASYAEKIEGRLFLEQLQSSITLIQNEAVLNGKRTKMATYPSNRLVRFTVVGESSHPANHTLTLPDNVSITSLSEDYYFSSETGNLSNINRITFRINGEDIELVFQMGSGRYEIRKIE
ncbi:competence type IV pilus minor pilin ComGD [Atopococcus tabaci]|uniref:competence type IV pilus minor pilin ComGD n=1 Tax=Atopococcus tabaci TaxID=269774 RepID=UPI0004154D35|nr:competence type IV pilus minor pilin ComGD [Atopococcus tabaci]